MADRPILFSAPMVRALLAGTKTQTRRVLKAGPHWETIPQSAAWRFASGYKTTKAAPPWVEAIVPTSYGATQILANTRVAARIGDRLWVREAVTRFDKRSCDQHIWYRAGGNINQHAREGLRYFDLSGGPDVEWPAGVEGPGGGAAYNVSPIFMPRWASRLTLTVTDVRVQRLQDISEEDAQAEGAEIDEQLRAAGLKATYRGGFARIWAGIHEPHPNNPTSWGNNPWVAAYTFSVEHRNIDAEVRHV